MARTNTLQVGDVVTQFLDGTDLLMQEVALNEVGHLSRKQESQVLEYYIIASCQTTDEQNQTDHKFSLITMHVLQLNETFPYNF